MMQTKGFKACFFSLLLTSLHTHADLYKRVVDVCSGLSVITEIHNSYYYLYDLAVFNLSGRYWDDWYTLGPRQIGRS